MKEKFNTCKRPSCDIQCQENEELCILHLQTNNKDTAEFVRTLDKYCDKNDYKFQFIHFPLRFLYLKGNNINKPVIFFFCTFYDEVDFSDCVFDDYVRFDTCTFKNMALFSKSQFKKNVLIRGCKFEDAVYFNEVKFFSRSFLYLNEFNHGANFYGAKYGPNFEMNRCEIGYSFFLNSEISKIKFTVCKWNDSYVLAEEQYSLRIPLDNNSAFALPQGYHYELILSIVKVLNRINLSPNFLIKILFPKEYSQQKELRKRWTGLYVEHSNWNELYMAENTYRELRKKYDGQGEPEVASKFFFREKLTQRKQKKTFTRILQYWFYERLFGYGERISRVVLSSALLILLCTLVYSGGGILDEHGKIIKDFWISLYFSVVTFSTLGYGDYRPLGWLRLVASSEAVLGALMIALFVVTLFRRWQR